MNKIILIFLLVYSSNSFGQQENMFGIETGLKFPNFALELRFKYLVKQKLELNLGLDGNSIVSLGRNIGINYEVVGFAKEKGTVFAGVMYDNTSKGIHSYFDENSGLQGSFSIPSINYINPILGVRILSDDNGTSPFKGIAFSLISSYKIPIRLEKVTLRNGDYSAVVEERVNNFIGRGLNVSLRVGWYFGK